jgi:hypothetical protein
MPGRPRSNGAAFFLLALSLRVTLAITEFLACISLSVSIVAQVCDDGDR